MKPVTAMVLTLALGTGGASSGTERGEQFVDPKTGVTVTHPGEDAAVTVAPDGNDPVTGKRRVILEFDDWGTNFDQPITVTVLE
jgi:hypothetical protein